MYENCVRAIAVHGPGGIRAVASLCIEGFRRGTYPADGDERRSPREADQTYHRAKGASKCNKNHENQKNIPQSEAAGFLQENRQSETYRPMRNA